MSENLTVTEPFWFDSAVGLGGVILGAFLGFGLQAYRDWKSDKKADYVAAYKLLNRVLRLMEELHSIADDLRRAQEARDGEMKDWELFRTWPARASPRNDAIYLDEDHLITLARLEDNDFYISILNIQLAVESFAGAANRLEMMREELAAKMKHTSVDGLQITSAFGPSELPLLINLQTLSQSMEEAIPESFLKAKKAAEELGPKLKEKLGLRDFKRLSFPSELQSYFEKTERTSNGNGESSPK